MFYSDEFELSLSYARQAMQYLEKSRTPATPQFFELWYCYATGQSRPLNKAVDTALDDDGFLSRDAAARIYDDYFTEHKFSESIHDLSAKVSEEIEQVTQMVQTAAGTTHAYGESLGEVNKTLGKSAGAIDEGALKTVVERLVLATAQAEESNRALEERLQDSKQQIATLHKDLETVRNETMTDQLTGIANRRCFDQEIRSMLDAAADEGSEFSLVLGDIDHFKKFNDSYGHQTGDQVIRLVARALKSNLKGRDLAARYGGEEFAVLLPRTSLTAGETVSNQIRENVRSKELVKKSSGVSLGTITMSFGVAQFRPGEAPDALIARADACLYAAKNAGRDCVISENDPRVSLDTAPVETEPSDPADTDIAASA